MSALVAPTSLEVVELDEAPRETAESRAAVAWSYVAVVGFWVGVIAVTGFLGGVTQ